MTDLWVYTSGISAQIPQLPQILNEKITKIRLLAPMPKNRNEGESHGL